MVLGMLLATLFGGNNDSKPAANPIAAAQPERQLEKRVTVPLETKLPAAVATNTTGAVYTTDAQPSFAADGITVRIIRILVVPPEFRRSGIHACADELEGTTALKCLLIEWSFDVAPTFRTNKYTKRGGSLSAGSFLSSEGTQHRQIWSATGLPGSRNNSLSAMFPLTTPDGTLHFQTGSNFVGWTHHEYAVPN
jgi:hypothetical protein